MSLPPTRLVGIDPGSTGALACFDGDELREVVDMPYDDGHVSGVAVADLLDAWQPDHVVIERAQSMPGQGVASTFGYGRGYGTLLGVVAALRIPYETINASTWKRQLGISRPGLDVRAKKAAARRMASERFPTFAINFKRVKDDGRAEAALIGLWWHQRHATGEAPGVK